MSFNFDSKGIPSVSVNSFSEILKALNLPRPEEKDMGFVATAPTVRCWVRHYNTLMNESMQGVCTLDHADLLFCQCMFVIMADLEKYVYDRSIYPEDVPEGVPSTYCVWFY
jgi:hypothetical protein